MFYNLLQWLWALPLMGHVIQEPIAENKAPGLPIRYNNAPQKCLDVQDAKFENGTPVRM